MGPDQTRSREIGGLESVPGKGPGATVSYPLKITAGARSPGRSVRPLGSPLEGPARPLRRVTRPVAGAQSEWGRPRDGAGTRTWAFGTPAPRPSHLQPPQNRPGSGRCPQEAPPERGRGREAVAGARGQRVGLPMAGDRREARAAGARAPGGRTQPAAQVCRSGGHVRGRAGGVGLRGWRLVITPGRGGSAARLRLHWGPAEPRGGPDVSAGGFVRPQPGPQPGSARAGVAAKRAASSGTPRASSEGRGNRKSQSGGWGPRGAGLEDLGGADLRPRRELFQPEGALAVLAVTHCADKETEAPEADSRTAPVFGGLAPAQSPGTFGSRGGGGS